MRICRYDNDGRPEIAFYCDDAIVPLKSAAESYAAASGNSVSVPDTDCLLQCLPPDGIHAESTAAIWKWLDGSSDAQAALRIETEMVDLLVPVARPNKLFLLAGNYAKHIEEGGGIAAEREETFPYVFMKPPTTTLTHPGKPISIPTVSPHAIDWELELAVIIGREAKGVSEADALDYVAGFTVINDISDRKFKPNTNRKPRDKDGFFDWLHGKWHDGSCPCGPAIASCSSIADPQDLSLELRLNGELRQDSSTSQQVFPVAAVIEFISSFVTLEPGDIISTGTPAGVGNTTGTYLKPGDILEASIGSIGTLRTPVE